ncbi:MAG: hypothetical protein GC152_06230 [Alphaproteobacteria bacterium]|nr:hypothetical protein [Alphaproteobacteria bacterium]
MKTKISILAAVTGFLLYGCGSPSDAEARARGQAALDAVRLLTVYNDVGPPDESVLFRLSETKLRQFQKMEVLHRLELGDFATLEAMAEHFRSGNRTGSGLSRLALFYEAFLDSDVSKNGEIDPYIAPAFDAWIDAAPGSPTPYLAKSVALFGALHQYYYARELAPNQIAQMEKAYANARAFHDAFRTRMDGDPHASAQDVALAAFGSDGGLDWKETYEAARKAAPGYFPVYFLALEFAPEFHFGPERARPVLDGIARDLAQDTPAAKDSGYARAYWALASRFGLPALIADEQERWARIKAGFSDMLADHPDAWNLAALFRFACEMGDWKEVRRTSEAVARTDEEHIIDPRAMDYCLTAAKTPGQTLVDAARAY